MSRIIKPFEEIPQTEDIIIYLAGSIRGRDWRSEIIEYLDATDNIMIINPMDKEWSNENVKWELDVMMNSDIVMFAFLRDTLSAVSLFELGLVIRKNHIIVYNETKFWRYDYINRLRDIFSFDCSDSFEEVKRLLIKHINLLKASKERELVIDYIV